MKSIDHLLQDIESGLIHIRRTRDYRIDEVSPVRFDGDGVQRIEEHCKRVDTEERKETPLSPEGAPSERAAREVCFEPNE